MNKRNVLSLCLIIFALFLFMNCLTPKDIYLDTVSEEDRAKLSEIELDLIQYSFSSKADYLEHAEKILTEIENKETVNNEFIAHLSCLKAEYLFYTKGMEAINNIDELIEIALKYNPREENIYLVRALLAEDLEQKKELLMEASDFPKVSRVHIELGNIYFLLSDYQQAVVYFDKGLKNGRPVYEEYYSEKRDIAFSLIHSDLDTVDNSFLLQTGDLSLQDLVKVISTETTLLSSLQLSLESGTYFSTLQENGFFLYPQTTPDRTTMRKDVAFFIAVLIALKEDNPELLNETSDYYLEMGWDSPIPDILVKDTFFSEAILMVELEIMELPDGINFFPNQPVTSQELLEIITQLKKLFPEE